MPGGPMALRSRNPNVQQSENQLPGKDGVSHNLHKRVAGGNAVKGLFNAASGCEKAHMNEQCGKENALSKDTEPPKAKRRAPFVELDLKQQPQSSQYTIAEQPSLLRMELSNVCIDSAKRTSITTRQALYIEEKSAGTTTVVEQSAVTVEAKPIEEGGDQPIGLRTRSRSSAITDTNKTGYESALDASHFGNASALNEYDYDKENAKDITAVSLYATDIFHYYKYREKLFKVGNYMTRQPYVTVPVRVHLVDWMVEVQENLQMNHETLYLGVKLVDMFLDRVSTRVDTDKLQLIGSAALFIAAKFDERAPPPIDDFIDISGESFDCEGLMAMERHMLSVVDFDLGAPLSYRFLRRYARVTKIEMLVLTLARYVLETSLMFFDFCRVSESLMAAAAYLLAVRMKGIADWCPVVEHYSGFILAEVEPLMWTLNHMVIRRKVEYGDMETVYNKYSHEIFYEVALTKSLEDRFPASAPIGPPVELLPPSPTTRSLRSRARAHN